VTPVMDAFGSVAVACNTIDGEYNSEIVAPAGGYVIATVIAAHAHGKLAKPSKSALNSFNRRRMAMVPQVPD
jgi:hypothetical protein